MSKHHLHPDIVKRLKRAAGHLNKVIANAKTTLVTQHIEDCLDEIVPTSKKDQLKEFKEITKYL